MKVLLSTILVALVVPAQAGAQGAPALPAPVLDAAAQQKILLSPGVRKLLADELAQHNHPAGADTVHALDLSLSESNQYLDVLRKRHEFDPTVQQMQMAMVDAKVDSARTAWSDLIAAASHSKAQKLDAAARDALMVDLGSQAWKLAESGLSADEVKARNAAFIDAVLSGFKESQPGAKSLGYSGLTGRRRTLTLAAYVTIRLSIFKHLVRVTIRSEPDGATVSVEGAGIGTTAIEGKPLRPEKTYTFVFSKPGYQTARRRYFVSPGGGLQYLMQVLQPVSDAPRR